MPHTRRLFKRGGRSYSNAFSTTPLCCPSRSSIMTGLYAHNHGILDNRPNEQHLLRLNTLQARLSSLGYETAFYGKFLNNWPLQMNPPHFDDFGVMDHEYRNTRWNFNGQVGVVPGYTTDIVGSSAVDFIETQRASLEPWMMYVAPYAPHKPFTPQRAFADAKVDRWKGNPAVREKNRQDKPPGVRKARTTPAKGATVRAKQFRTLMSVDLMVKRVFGLGESVRLGTHSPSTCRITDTCGASTGFSRRAFRTPKV